MIKLLSADNFSSFIWLKQKFLYLLLQTDNIISYEYRFCMIKAKLF